MERIILLFSILNILVGCKESLSEPKIIKNNWSKIYNADNISEFTSTWNDTTRSATLTITFNKQTKFSGQILITENDKYRKKYLGNGFYNFTPGGKQNFKYEPEDHIGGIYFIMEDWIYGHIDSNTIGVVDTVLWAESFIEFGKMQ